MNSVLYVVEGTVLFTALLFHMLPVWQRRGLFFGITVRPEFYSEHAYDDLVRQFRIFNVSVAILSLAIAVAVFRDTPQGITFVAAAQPLAGFGMIIRMRKQARAWAGHETAIHRAALNAEHARMPGGCIAFALPLLLFAVAAWFLDSSWDKIPERFPVHYNAAGEANQWGTKTVKSVYSPLIIGLTVQLLLLFVAVGMARGTRRADPQGSRMRMVRTSLWLMLIMQWATALLICAISVQPALPEFSMKYIVWTVTGIIVATSIGFVIRLGQLQAEPSDETSNTPEECWYLASQIYYNPDDPALMVEKRLGIGYTVNLGNKLTWAFLPLVLLIALGPVLLFK